MLYQIFICKGIKVNLNFIIILFEFFFYWILYLFIIFFFFNLILFYCGIEFVDLDEVSFSPVFYLIFYHFLGGRQSWYIGSLLKSKFVFTRIDIFIHKFLSGQLNILFSWAKLRWDGSRSFWSISLIFWFILFWLTEIFCMSSKESAHLRTLFERNHKVRSRLLDFFLFHLYKQRFKLYILKYWNLIARLY